MEEPAGLRLTEIVLMIALGAIWGASFLFMRLAVGEFGALPLIFVRVFVAGVFLAIAASLQHKQSEMFRAPLKMTVVGIVNSALPFTLFALGTQLLSAGFASVLNATAPFFGALVAVAVFRESLSKAKWIGLAIGFLGVCELVIGNRSIEGSVTGVAVCLLAALCYGLAAHFTRRQLVGVSPIAVAAASQVTATLVLFPLACMTWPETMPSVQSWCAAVALGILCTGVALAIYFYLLSAVGPTRAMSVGYLIPLFGVLWGSAFLGEQLTVSLAIGGAMILAGLFFINSK